MKLDYDRKRKAQPSAERAYSAPVNCAQSFFSGVASRAHKIRKERIMLLLLALVVTIVCVAAPLLSPKKTFALYINGEAVGSVATRDEALLIVERAEQQLSQELGYEYSLAETVSVSPINVSDAPTETVGLEEAIILNVPDVRDMAVIEMDGIAIGAFDTREEVEAMLTAILDEFTTERTVSITIKNSIAVRQRLVGDDEDVIRDAAALAALLKPDSGSNYALTIESVENVTHWQALPFETIYTDDDAMFIDEETVTTEGVAGDALVTEQVVFVNGKEESRTDLSTMTVVEPIALQIVRGTKEHPKTASTGEYGWPADGVLTSDFGYRNVEIGSSNHQGIDIGGASGQDILASDGGEVILAGESSGYGLLVQIKHDNGDVTYYGHNSKLLVAVGDKVAKGQLIAEMGRTGVTSGVHCHFEIRKNGIPVDPLKHLK
ncbi:MAG: peptidoglycan DD-metalloendopeptidase family protein [Oscillospiraceae bacterium]|nr:peptidoglycan DD-metalloendopeptidase family protein [Oscillospiraceae bacterium]